MGTLRVWNEFRHHQTKMTPTSTKKHLVVSPFFLTQSQNAVEAPLELPRAHRHPRLGPGQVLLPVPNLPGEDGTQTKWDQGIPWENALVGTIASVKFKVCVPFFFQEFCLWILRSLVSVKLSWFMSIIWVCRLSVLLIIVFTVSVEFGVAFLTGSPLPWTSGHTPSIPTLQLPHRNLNPQCSQGLFLCCHHFMVHDGLNHTN